jgi:crotonobetainyl-CoA:carnitine CoA-transferase CaiB-like acyl-CoA transferase
MPARLAHRAFVDELVSVWVAERDAARTLEILAAAEVPSSPVMSVADLFTDPQVQARHNIVSIAAGALGALAMPGVVPRLTATPGQIRSAGPATPGEHNEEIYCGRLGLSRAELGRLQERGIV